MPIPFQRIPTMPGGVIPFLACLFHEGQELGSGPHSCRHMSVPVWFLRTCPTILVLSPVF